MSPSVKELMKSRSPPSVAMPPGPAPNPAKLASFLPPHRIHDGQAALALRVVPGIHDVEQPVAADGGEAGVSRPGQRDGIHAIGQGIGDRVHHA